MRGRGTAAPGRARRSATPRVAQTAPLRHVAVAGEARGNRPPGCGALWKMAQLGKRTRDTARQTAGRFAPGPTDPGARPDLTERRSLRDFQAQSASLRALRQATIAMLTVA